MLLGVLHPGLCAALQRDPGGHPQGHLRPEGLLRPLRGPVQDRHVHRDAARPLPDDGGDHHLRPLHADRPRRLRRAGGHHEYYMYVYVYVYVCIYIHIYVYMYIYDIISNDILLLLLLTLIIIMIITILSIIIDKTQQY